jgi:carboxyl-terminal processing protease
VEKKIKYEILNDIVSKQQFRLYKRIVCHIRINIKKRTIENEICKINFRKKSAFEENLLNHFAVILTHIPPISLWILNPLMASLSKEHLSLGLNVSLNDRNEIIIIELDPNGPAFQTEWKKGDQIISISNLKKRYKFPATL